MSPVLQTGTQNGNDVGGLLRITTTVVGVQYISVPGTANWERKQKGWRQTVTSNDSGGRSFGKTGPFAGSRMDRFDWQTRLANAFGLGVCGSFTVAFERRAQTWRGIGR